MCDLTFQFKNDSFPNTNADSSFGSKFLLKCKLWSSGWKKRSLQIKIAGHHPSSDQPSSPATDQHSSSMFVFVRFALNPDRLVLCSGRVEPVTVVALGEYLTEPYFKCSVCGGGCLCVSPANSLWISAWRETHKTAVFSFHFFRFWRRPFSINTSSFCVFTPANQPTFDSFPISFHGIRKFRLSTTKRSFFNAV